MRKLNLKLARDSWHMKSQLVAIVLIVASAVATFITMRGSYDALVRARSSYYAEYRFPHVFAHVRRAPRPVLSVIREIPGVRAAEGRIVSSVNMDVPGLPEPATGRIVSIPRRPEEMLSLLYLRRGRMPEPGHDAEVVASEQFCKANRLRTGDSLSAVINGRWRELEIVGIGFSPEYVNEIATASAFPDHARFGVLWMLEEPVAAAFAMRGAWNDLVISISPGADERQVIAHVDRLLERYGSGGAYGRMDQVSHRFLEEEIAQDRVTATVIPGIFLLVSAFLIHMVLSRLVASQRDQIAILKAFGYDSWPIALHYLGFAIGVVVAGSLVGIPAGIWLGSELAELYRKFFSFPDFSFRTNPAAILVAVGVSIVSAAAAALGAARRAMSVPPAEGMRGEMPAGFASSRAAWLEKRLAPGARMVVRSIGRRPVRAALSIIGIALAVMILIAGRYTFDALDAVIDTHFRRAMRDDATVSFIEPRSMSVQYELARLPGVTSVELFRALPVRMSSKNRSRRGVVMGMSQDAGLRRLIGGDGRQIHVPPRGAIITEKLGRVLGLSRGDEIHVEPLDGRGRPFAVQIVATTDELIGGALYMHHDELARYLREPALASGAWLSVERSSRQELSRVLKTLPTVGGTSFREAMLQSFADTIAENLRISGGALVFFACVIAFGVIYNSARIALSERGRDLATLRVIGFTRREVGTLLLAEQTILTLIAIPVGSLMGWGIAQWFSRLFESEDYRLPADVSLLTFVFAFLIVSGATILSAAAVWNRVRSLDLIEVLKTRE